LEFFAIPKLLERIKRRSAMVVLIDDLDMLIAHGTGTCVRIAHRYLIATAGHHFVDQPELHHVGVTTLTKRSDHHVVTLGHNHRGGGRTDAVDVAWIELEPGAAQALETDFVPLGGMDPSYRGVASDGLFVYGFPGKPLVSDGPDWKPEFDFKSIGYATCARDVTSVAAEYRPDAVFDVFADYPREVNVDAPEGWLKAAPDPGGLSGAGLWRINMRKAGIWTFDDVQLVAVQHEAVRSDRWLRGTRIRHWLELVRDDFPDLASTIDPVLQRSN
jgi:hypothetical protein